MTVNLDDKYVLVIRKNADDVYYHSTFYRYREDGQYYFSNRLGSQCTDTIWGAKRYARKWLKRYLAGQNEWQEVHEIQ